MSLTAFKANNSISVKNFSLVINKQASIIVSEGTPTASVERGSLNLDLTNGTLYINTSASGFGNTWTNISTTNIVAGNGISYNSGTNTISTNLSTSSGLTNTAGTGSQLSVVAGFGISVSSNVAVATSSIIDATKGLTTSSNVIQINPTSGKGIVFNGSTGAIEVQASDIVNTNYALTTASNKIQVTTDSNGGLEINGTSHGLQVKLDGTTLATSSNGIKVNTVGNSQLDQSQNYTWTGTNDFTGGVTKVATPVNSNEAATKAYADSIASGITVKSAVRVATTGSNILLSYTGPRPVIDGYTVQDNDRVLIKDQSTTSQNGIYYLVNTGGSLWIFSRTIDFDGNPSNEVAGGDSVFVMDGSLNAQTGWVVVATSPITVGTTPIIWTQYTGAGSFSAGNGLTRSYNTIDVNPGNGIVIDTDHVAMNIDTNYGLKFDGTNPNHSKTLQLNLESLGGLTLNSGALKVNTSDITDTNYGLTTNSNKMRINLDAGGSLAFNSGALGITLGTNSGLSLTSGLHAITSYPINISGGNIGLNYSTNAGLNVVSNNLVTKIDTTNNSTAFDGSGNITVPSMSRVPSLTTLTGGADAIDSVAIGTYRSAEWLVTVKNGNSGTYTSKIIGSNLGTGTTSDYTEYGILELGTITSPAFSVTVSGATMYLYCTGTSGYTVSITRIANA